jgi:hypothetical protein
VEPVVEIDEEIVHPADEEKSAYGKRGKIDFAEQRFKERYDAVNHRAALKRCIEDEHEPEPVVGALIERFALGGTLRRNIQVLAMDIFADEMKSKIDVRRQPKSGAGLEDVVIEFVLRIDYELPDGVRVGYGVRYFEESESGPRLEQADDVVIAVVVARGRIEIDEGPERKPKIRM